MAAPLSHVRVIDMTSVLMGPYATQWLGDFGADVVKVEPPQGDVVRQVGPARSPGMGALYINANRSKRSLSLDLTTPEARAVMLRLIEGADVLVYNNRPQSMARLGLGYEAVSAVNPRLIYCGCFGYGQGGPYAARPAYDDLIQGAVLLPWLHAQASGGEPRYVPTALSDRVVGLMTANAVMAALMHLERTGEGQRIDVPMFESMAAFVLGDHLGGQSFDPPLDAGGYRRQMSPDRRPYKTRDGHVCALIYTDKQWRSFLGAIGRPEAFDADPRLADLGMRSRHIDALLAEVSEIFLTRTTTEWLELLQAADVPVMPLHDIASLLDDPHLNAVGAFVDEQHPTEGALRRVRPGGDWSRTPPGPTRHAPRLGEHSREVLAEAGYAAEEIAALVAAGAVVAAEQA